MFSISIYYLQYHYIYKQVRELGNILIIKLIEILVLNQYIYWLVRKFYPCFRNFIF